MFLGIHVYGVGEHEKRLVSCHGTVTHGFQEFTLGLQTPEMERIPKHKPLVEDLGYVPGGMLENS